MEVRMREDSRAEARGFFQILSLGVVLLLGLFSLMGAGVTPDVLPHKEVIEVKMAHEDDSKIQWKDIRSMSEPRRGIATEKSHEPIYLGLKLSLKSYDCEPQKAVREIVTGIRREKASFALVAIMDWREATRSCHEETPEKLAHRAWDMIEEVRMRTGLPVQLGAMNEEMLELKNEGKRRGFHVRRAKTGLLPWAY